MIVLTLEQTNSLLIMKNQYNGRYVLLRKACERSGHKNSTEYKAFLEKNEAWVYDYCLYMAVKKSFWWNELD